MHVRNHGRSRKKAPRDLFSLNPPPVKPYKPKRKHMPRQLSRPCAQCGAVRETVWLRDKKISGELICELSRLHTDCGCRSLTLTSPFSLASR
jgi:hypothetical protein